MSEPWHTPPPRTKASEPEPEQEPAGPAGPRPQGRPAQHRRAGESPERRQATRIGDYAAAQDALPGQNHWRFLPVADAKGAHCAPFAWSASGPRGRDRVSGLHPECGECALFKAGSRYIVARCGRSPGSGPNAAPPDDPPIASRYPLLIQSRRRIARAGFPQLFKSNTMSGSSNRFRQVVNDAKGFLASSPLKRRRRPSSCTCPSRSRAAVAAAGRPEGVAQYRRPEGPAGRGSPGRVSLATSRGGENENPAWKRAGFLFEGLEPNRAAGCPPARNGGNEECGQFGHTRPRPCFTGLTDVIDVYGAGPHRCGMRCSQNRDCHGPRPRMPVR